LWLEDHGRRQAELAAQIEQRRLVAGAGKLGQALSRLAIELGDGHVGGGGLSFFELPRECGGQFRVQIGSGACQVAQPSLVKRREVQPLSLGHV